MKIAKPFFLGLGLLLCATQTLGKELILGSIGEDASAQLAIFQPLAGYLADRLKEHGIDKGGVLVTRSIPDMAEQMRERRVDIFIDSPYPALAVSERAQGEIQLRRWKKGKAVYDSVFLTLKDSGITSLKDLAGKRVAFEEPYSTSGYFLPRSELTEAGMNPTPLDNPNAPIPAGRVGYYFAGDIRSSLAQLLWKRADAIALGSHEYEAFKAQETAAVRVIHQSIPLPRHVVVFRGDMDKGLATAIRDILMGMEQSEKGRKVLATFEKTSRFDEIPKEGIKALAQLRREMHQAAEKTRP